MKFKFGYIMLFFALSVAGCAAYFSVFGLSQLFAGASTAIIIMASFLELGKIVTTTALHRYWTKISNSLKIYLTISVVVLMLITSAGIYGFLSNAYQKTSNKLEIHEGEIKLLETKKEFFQKGIDDNKEIISLKNKRIEKLNELRTNQENRLDLAKTNIQIKRVREDIKSANIEIQKLTSEIDFLNTKNFTLTDSINFYVTKTLSLKSNNDIVGEVGPLKYISELTGQPMNKVVNLLILLLIFVFDPLAIAMVLMTNKVFEMENSKTFLKNNGELITEKIKEETIAEESKTVQNDNEESETVKDNIEESKTQENNRGFSVNIPQAKTSNNTIERIGSNKLIKNGDNKRLFFKRK